MMNLKKWLKKPYPLIEKTQGKLILVFGFAVFTSIFLLIYEPFGVEEVTQNKTVFLLGFGGCVLFGLLINYIVLPKVLPKLFRSENWTIKKEVIYVVWSFALISIFNYLYNTIIGAAIARYQSWFAFLGITFSIGIFPLLGLIYFVEKNQKKKHTRQAEKLSKTIYQDHENLEMNTRISIRPETLKSEPLQLYLRDFIFARSDNNYTTILYLDHDQPQQKLLRLSMKNLEGQLSVFKDILRCHRSYLVNKQKIKNIKGNARSLVLILEYYDQAIPISRSFSKEKLV